MFNFLFGNKSTSIGTNDAPSSFTSSPTLKNLSNYSHQIYSPSGYNYWQDMWYCARNALSTINCTGTIGNGYLMLGTGTTAPTADDYCLESPITTNLSCDSVSVSKTSLTKTYTATFTNSGSSDITVTEVGFIVYILYAYSATTENSDNFLMDITVLETPITIPAGESRTVTYELSF
jgi:hypothetical protein